MTRDIHCVTTWSKFNTFWEGVLIDDLLGEANLEAPTAYTLAHSYDGYSTNVPAADLLVRARRWWPPDTPASRLRPNTGGPARLLVPHLYFWKSAKWVNALQFTERDELGFWELRGYHRYEAIPGANSATPTIDADALAERPITRIEPRSPRVKSFVFVLASRSRPGPANTLYCG